MDPQDTDLSGAHGKAIVAMRKEGLPHIYSSWEVIYKAVKEKRLTLHGTFHSYCKMATIAIWMGLSSGILR
ncbi:hypothetical protein CEQ50_15760 [Vibrio anguillarum]|nr:hypothetical protein CEQ50_15760 [Vibrio anguillarum]